MEFDPATGVIRCEAGVLLSEIMRLVVPKGWFLPVLPGTGFVTVGGAIANDIHGKNHHRAGTFGCHVLCLELLRSDKGAIVCSADLNGDLFRATIGGLGLTGVILWAEIALKQVRSPAIDVQSVCFPNLEAFFQLSAESDREYEYTVAWIDCLAKGDNLGRGIFIRGNHSDDRDWRAPGAPGRGLNIPIDLPFSPLNRRLIRAFNTLHYRRQGKLRTRSEIPYQSFFFPLDVIGHWNRLYGPPGFFQYQCVVPLRDAKEIVREILSRIAHESVPCFLGVLKVFGPKPSPGLLSFPRQGVTLALDFPNQGKKTLRLMESLDRILAAAGGSLYPAKDARMSPESFKRFFPRWERLEAFRDPGFSSSFWRRVTRG